MNTNVHTDQKCKKPLKKRRKKRKKREIIEIDSGTADKTNMEEEKFIEQDEEAKTTKKDETQTGKTYGKSKLQSASDKHPEKESHTQKNVTRPTTEDLLDGSTEPRTS